MKPKATSWRIRGFAYRLYLSIWHSHGKGELYREHVCAIQEAEFDLKVITIGLNVPGLSNSKLR
jgi:hypothetical protein